MALKSVDPDGLYPQQRKAIDAMFKWYGSDQLEFTLGGYAGTGKTHVVSTFIKLIGKGANACITAPTHKALRVVEKQVGIKGKTLHSLHGLRMNVDLLNFDIENPQFDPMGTPHIQNFKLVVVDEASMVNSHLFTLTRRNSIIYKTKILYVGDPLQLPPIRETNSKAFTDVPNYFNLTDIIRQSSDNDMLELFIMLRDDIINKTNNCVSHLIQARNKKISKNYKVLSLEPYTTKLLEYFNHEAFTADLDYIRQACFSRMAVADWNHKIRHTLIQDDKELVNINDIFTAYANQIDDNKNPILKNSDDYILEDIDKYVNDVGISTFAVNMTNVYDKKMSPKLLILNHNDKSSVTKFLDLLNYFHYRAKYQGVPGGFKNYYKFKDSILIMRNLALNERNKYKTVSKDIDYGYALTIHKLQGSTMKNIAVDLYDIIYPSRNTSFVNDIDQRNRLLYVALSRATDNAIIRY